MTGWTVLGVVLLLGTLCTAYAVYRFVRFARAGEPQAPSRPAGPTKNPLSVVLVHGILGYDRIRVFGNERGYFYKVRERLQEEGHQVLEVRLPPLEGIEVRAAALTDQISRYTDRPAIMVAHSMGGLDARYALHKLGLDAYAQALVTIGTPHQGTPIGDLSHSILDRLWLGRSLKFMGVDPKAVVDLSTPRVEAFNRATPDVEGIYYGSVISRADPKTLNALLRPTHRYLSKRAGENDGLVPTQSQAYGEVLIEAKLDHWAQTGWTYHAQLDVPATYARIVRLVRTRLEADPKAKASASLKTPDAKTIALG